MNEKALESFINNCDNMMIVNEGLTDRFHLRISKLKFKDGEGKYDGASTGLTYKGAPVELYSKLSSVNNAQQKDLIVSTIKKIMTIVDKSYTKEYNSVVDGLLETAKEWGTNASNKSELEKVMKLELVTVFYRFNSMKDGLEKFPLSSSTDKETYRKENQERDSKLKEFTQNYKNESINVATVDFWYNNKPNSKFFGGHTLILSFNIKDGKVQSVTSTLEG